MTSVEGARLPGTFTLCEDLPGEILATKLAGMNDNSGMAEKGNSDCQHSGGKGDDGCSKYHLYTHEKDHNSTRAEDLCHSDNKGDSGQLLDPLLARLSDNQLSNEKHKHSSHSKQKGSIRSRVNLNTGDSSSPFYSPMSGMASPTDNGNHTLGPLSDLSGPSTDNSNDMFSYKPITTLHDVSRMQTQTHSSSSKHHVMGDDRSGAKLAKHSLDQGHSQSNHREDVTEQTINNLQRALNSTNQRTSMGRTDGWPFDDPTGDQASDGGESMTAAYNRQSTIWGATHKPSITQLPAMPLPSPAEMQFTAPASRSNSMDHGDYFGPNRGWGSSRRSSSFQPGPTGPPVSGEPRMYSRRPSFNSAGQGFARTTFDYTSGHQPSPTTASYTPSPIGTPLSPTATEFTASSGAASATVWNSHGQDSSSTQQTYVSTIEPLNYRRLLERSVNCNWKYIVDKIVCNNDQQASIFLQQKLKIGTPEQKHAIVDAIVSQAYPLMVNRFGNFLVQRCFEHGTPEQIDGIANSIRGNTLALSMDAFGCHVVQKALDCVNEEFKATMVSELLRRIPETVIHRYACHVWQKLFELRWVDAPPQIMKYVNEALRGRWSEVALGETGSLVVQNIFENCLEEDKRPCINEVLANIDLIAHGQFGNWCIQHICEHGAPADRSRAIDVVIHNAPEYSMDQYASKVVEKCLKIGGNEFLERYLDRVCEGRSDRPRIPLIDIASDQYGNYLVQWILQHSSPTHREQVASHIRKHMVSLRGSKFGSRVGMLCCNPIYTRAATSGGSPHTASTPASATRFNRYGFR